MVTQAIETPGRRRLHRWSPRSGALTTELVVAMGILIVGVLPLVYSFAAEQRLLRSYYQRALATELVDGEMEVLAAGHWRSFAPGSQPYEITGGAVSNLPPGQFILTLTNQTLKLEWRPSKTFSGRGSAVSREVRLP